MLAVVSGPSDSELVARVVVGDDRHAFATLVRRHQGPVRGFLRRLCGGDQARADDAAQDSFLLAYRHLDSWRGEGELRSWLLKLAFRSFLNDERRAHRKREQRDAAVPDGASTAIDATERRDVLRALGSLKPEERAALALCFQEGLTHEEAALVLEMPLGTLKSHVARGKEKLKVLLAAYRTEAA